MNKDTKFNEKTFHYLNCFERDCYQCYNYSVDFVDTYVSKWELSSKPEAPYLFTVKPDFCFAMNYHFYHKNEDQFWKRKTENDYYGSSQIPKDERFNILEWHRFKNWLQTQTDNEYFYYEQLDHSKTKTY